MLLLWGFSGGGVAMEQTHKLMFYLSWLIVGEICGAQGTPLFSSSCPLRFYNPYECTQSNYECSCKKGFCKYHMWKSQRNQNYANSCHHFFSGLVADVIQLNLNLFSLQSLEVVAGIFPAYVGARMVDEKLQSYFFSHKTHKNINGFPHWCKDAARLGISVPIVLFGLEAFLSPDVERRTTGWVFLLGMPFVIFGKDLIKRAEFDCCLRPWHEKWCAHNHKRCYGGFPSGHMAEISYITILYGMRYGPRYAIPLGLYAGALGVIFINCNRHYLSQLVGGIGLGAVYALAANRLIESKLNDSVNAGLRCDSKGNPALELSCRF